MDPNKDYYSILGVLPTAHEVVIRAAYRALAQRYHPDRNDSSCEASKKMQEINEAYEVLSNLAIRNQYDESHQRRGADFSSEQDDVRSAFEEATNAFTSKWQTAVEYFPDLDEIVGTLRQTSYRLGFAFQALLLETRNFEARAEIAESLQRNFLETYFGTQSKILAFAKKLISINARDAAKELNRAVFVLGNDTDPDRIIGRIEEKYQLWRCHAYLDKFVVRLAQKVVGAKVIATDEAETLVKKLGGHIAFHVLSREIVFGNPKKVRIAATLLGKTLEFEDTRSFLGWVKDEVAPRVIESIAGNHECAGSADK